MTLITKEVVLKIARMSDIKIHDHEIDSLVNRLEHVLSYAARVQEVSVEVNVPVQKNVNVLREDAPIRFDAESILMRAPESEERYFVVPAILDTNK